MHGVAVDVPRGFPLKHSNSICSPTRASYTYQAQRSNNETHNSNNRLSWPIFPSHNEENTSSRQQRTSEQPISEDSEIRTTTAAVERVRRDSQKSQAGALERVLCPNDARVMERANQIVIGDHEVGVRNRLLIDAIDAIDAYDQNIFMLLVWMLVTIIYDPDLSFACFLHYLMYSNSCPDHFILILFLLVTAKTLFNLPCTAGLLGLKNKSFRPRERGKKGLKNLQSVKTLAGRTQSNQQLSGVGGKARKQPLTVTAQFQQSLQSLMDTLNQANPFFIRCIKSNGNKASCVSSPSPVS
uniref:Myosin motor domain-containing protein n=1 Tax=Timema monikensis TaxID=170555 RepID=A0A7R9HPW0_9NEOP|nr:unnamed protein product [Timema monikensis]